MGVAFSVAAVFSDRERGVSIWVDYNDGNRRIRAVNWTVPAGVRARARVWSNGNPVVDQTVVGPAAGETSVGGNRQMVQVTVGGQTYWDLPPDITYSVEVGNA